MPTARWVKGVARQLCALLLASACLLSWGTASAAAQAADPAVRLDEVRDKLGQAREGLGTIERRRAGTIEDLRRLEAEQEALRGELQTLRQDLSEAETALARAEAQVVQVNTRLHLTRSELAQTQARLEAQRGRFAARARASYKQGGAGLLEVALNTTDTAELAQTLKFVQVVMDADREQVELVADLERQTARSADQLAQLLERRAAAERVAAGERDHVAGLVARSEQLLASAEAKAAERITVLRELEKDKSSYTQLVAALEGESARLEEELRRRAAEEEARRRAAEEARRVAAAEAEARRRPPPADRGGGSAPVSTGRLQRPSDGRITSHFGYRTHPIFGTRRLHTGTDFGAPMGAPIYAAEDGVVISAGGRGGYGLATVIDHGGGISTLYAHQSDILVRAGQRVSRGQVIGRVGSTGYSTGPHLHFEVRLRGSPVNPLEYL